MRVFSRWYASMRQQVIAKATGHVAVTVNPSPLLVASDDSVTTVENAAVAIDVLANDTSPSGGTLALTGVTQGVDGSVAIVPTPNAAVTIENGQQISAGSSLAYD